MSYQFNAMVSVPLSEPAYKVLWEHATDSIHIQITDIRGQVSWSMPLAQPLGYRPSSKSHTSISNFLAMFTHTLISRHQFPPRYSGCGLGSITKPSQPPSFILTISLSKITCPSSCCQKSGTYFHIKSLLKAHP